MNRPDHKEQPPLNYDEWSTPADDFFEDFITDSAGYLGCGCHCSQREHTCIPDY